MDINKRLSTAFGSIKTLNVLAIKGSCQDSDRCLGSSQHFKPSHGVSVWGVPVRRGVVVCLPRTPLLPLACFQRQFRPFIRSLPRTVCREGRVDEGISPMVEVRIIRDPCK